METAIQKAALTKFRNDNNIEVIIDRETGDIKIHKVLDIVDKVEDSAREISLQEAIKAYPNNSDLKVGEKVFEELKISNIVSKYADGNLGWKEQIPFDRIIITAATPFISKEIESQINEGGIIVAPMIMKNKQVIVKYKKIGNKLESQIYDDVLFVPNLSGTE